MLRIGFPNPEDGMQHSCRALVLLAILAAAVPFGAARAMTVAPMQVEMNSAGARNHATVTVVNNSTEPLPVEAVIRRMSLDETGKAQTVIASEEFLVMPPQVLIAAGATQNFRIQWLGDPTLDTSQSFYIFFNQVPVKPPKDKAGVQVVMSMGVMVNVAPLQGSPSLQVVATGVATDGQGKRHPTITVENLTRVHALLPQSTIRLSGGAWSETLPPGLLGERLGSGLVQPGKRRKFVLPTELPAGVTAVQASVDMNPRRL